MESLIQRLVRDLQVDIVLSTEWHALNFLLRVDKGDDSTARAQDELRLVLEQHLDDLVSVSQQDGFLGSLPFLDVNQVALVVFFSDWGILLCEAKF